MLADGLAEESSAPLGFGRMGEIIVQAINKANEALDEDGYLADKHIKAMVDKHFGVLSLSTSATDPRLWSHYASSHKGVCFGFDKSAHPFGHARRVQYRSSMPIIHVSKLSQTDALVLTKSAKWRYEKEWRVVKRGAGIIQVPQSAIRLVIFGCECPEEDAIEVLSWFSTKNPPPAFAIAKKVPGSFELALHRIDTDAS